MRSRLLLYPTEGKSLLQSTVHLILKKASTNVSSFPSLMFVAPLVEDMHILQVWKATQSHNLKFTWKHQRNSTCPLALCLIFTTQQPDKTKFFLRASAYWSTFDGSYSAKKTSCVKSLIVNFHKRP